MLKKLKNIKITRRGVYISLAVCMLLLGIAGIFSAMRNVNKIVDQTKIDLNNISIPENVLGTGFLDEKKDNETSEPVIKDEPPVVLSFVMPVEGEISKKHSNETLVYSETMNDYRTHAGVDIIAPDGSTVVSVESGKITAIEKHPLWGNTVYVEHENGYKSCYKNLSDIIPEGIEVGSYVSRGGVIGSIGSSALVEIGEKPHLHFEMALNDKLVDPLEYIMTK